MKNLMLKALVFGSVLQISTTVNASQFQGKLESSYPELNGKPCMLTINYDSKAKEVDFSVEMSNTPNSTVVFGFHFVNVISGNSDEYIPRKDEGIIKSSGILRSSQNAIKIRTKVKATDLNIPAAVPVKSILEINLKDGTPYSYYFKMRMMYIVSEDAVCQNLKKIQR